MSRPLITLLTDFGSTDHYVAAMKGVILGICPDALIVDVTHEVKEYAVKEAALVLGQVWKTFPAGTVHVVVVDPGVGSARRPLVAEAGGQVFVGPDNGVLSGVLKAGSLYKVREITAAGYFRHPVSQTFHGRDVFAPVAAQLANGVSVAAMGAVVEDWVRLDCAPVKTGTEQWEGRILKVDRFGNLITNFESAIWGPFDDWPYEMTAGSARVTRVVSAYVERPVGELFVIAGSSGYLEISVNHGSAAAVTALGAGDTIGLVGRKRPEL